MRLDTVLEKTKKREKDFNKKLQKVQIATEDRPYDLLDTQQTNKVQSGNNVDTNQAKTRNKQGTKLEQTGDNFRTNKEQTKNNHIKIEHKKEISIEELVGLQREALAFLYQECKKTCSEKTCIVRLDNIVNHIKTNQDTAKTTLKRLIQKGFVERISFKNGRGGWTKYKIDDNIFQEMLSQENSFILSPKHF